MTTIRVEGFLKHFTGEGGFDLRADFEVRSEDRLAVIGPSGSGKTTLLRWIAGLDHADGGKLLIDGEDVTSLPPERRSVGLVFQDQALFPLKTIEENAAFGLKMRGMPRDEMARVVRPWLERLGLASRLSTPIDRLSGGERQRLALIRALVWKPRVLLLDEPFTALDAPLRERLRAEVRALHDELKIPLILVTHDEEDVRAIATAKAAFTGGQTRVLTRSS